MMVTMEKILLQQLLPQLDQYSWIDVRQEFE